MTWRLADSLKLLREQINAQYPNRSKESDGAIGDAAHASRSSDHNPWVKDHRNPRGAIVTAIDVTHDPAHGLDGRKLAEKLIASRDPRIKYIISNAEICASYPSNGRPAWTWRPYSGSNAHRHHMHISVNSEPVHYDSVRPWNFDGVSVPIVAGAGGAATVSAKAGGRPELARGAKGGDVGYLQRMLGIDDDEEFGAGTEKAVWQFQVRSGLPVTGKVDVATWAALIA